MLYGNILRVKETILGQAIHCSIGGERFLWNKKFFLRVSSSFVFYYFYSFPKGSAIHLQKINASFFFNLQNFLYSLGGHAIRRNYEKIIKFRVERPGF